jgi:hypothetical protein
VAATSGRSLRAQRLAASWSESRVTWRTQPATTGGTTTTTSGIGYRAWAVTSHVRSMYTGPNYGFLIREVLENQNAQQAFASRERTTNRPELLLRFAPAGG